MIRLGALFPEHLNLNGDFGNLEVISKQLKWRGLASETFSISSKEDLKQRLDFIFVGHGSLAAWADIQNEFSNMIPELTELFTAGLPGLAISTGFEELAKTGLFAQLGPTLKAERISKFEVFKDGDLDVLGYINTEVNLPLVHRERNWIGSMLHGPLLAKNPGLLEEVLESIASNAGLALPQIQEDEKVGQLADLISEVWKLEKELASE
jgi:CobQ-like glutamine amidotransferase family enzyme